MSPRRGADEQGRLPLTDSRGDTAHAPDAATKSAGHAV